MANLVCNGATLLCSCGATCSLIVTPEKGVMTDNQPAATIMSNKLTNIPSFGMCRSMGNPAVASATAAAFGVLTPQPCVPVIPAPWVPGNPQLLVGGEPALTSDSKCMCSYGGNITVTVPGQITVTSG
jgi:hypothetical protein